jgi:hypothetical protein
MNKAIIALPIAGVLALTGCSAPFTTFEDALSTCGNPSGVTVADEGMTLTIDMMGDEDYSGAGIYDIECVIDAIGVPAYIKDNIWATNALAGRQTDTFENITVSWAYHPDNGLDAVFHYSTD